MPTIGARAACRSARLPGRFVDQVSDGLADWPIPIVLNRMLMEHQWDLIINVGHVVPHEVLGLRQSQQELFHRPGGQGDDLHVAHHGRGVRHRKQPGQPDHAAAGLLQPGRRRVSIAAARFVRAGRAGPRRAWAIWSTPGVYVGDDLETYLAAARHSREQNITRLRRAGRARSSA